MHGLLPPRRHPSRRVAALTRSRGLRATGVLIAAAGLASAGLAASPALAVAPATVAHARPAPPAPLSAQHPVGAPHATRLPADVRRVCPVPVRAGQMECMSLVRTNTRHYRGIAPHETPAGYGPAQLQSAYNLAAAVGQGGQNETVAVVDAYDDPNAESDLAVYRSQYGLPACTTASGCFLKVNQTGQQGSYPPVDPSGAWEGEEAIDLDMVSAICPNCHILLVEASTNSLADLGSADDEAVTLGAKFVSDSWDGTEFPSESSYDNTYFNRPGVAIDVAAGDAGYGTGWPASAQYVTAVGGTSLTQDPGSPRGWAETVWNDTGSGCSAADPKPSWQTADDSAPDGCLNRTENDVSAVADPATGVASYNTYSPGTGWSEAGGTSVAAPIITSVYALAGTPAAGTYPASYPYQAASTALNDVTSGSNGSCEPARQYLCNGEPGYDGPSGLGTPDGTAAFTSSATGNVVTLADPGTQDEEAGTPAYLAMQGVDSAGQPLTYAATGLPSGLTINPGTGTITGVLGSTTGTAAVTVTATDGTGAKGSVTFSMVVVSPLTTGYAPVSGPVHVDQGNLCMDDAGNATQNNTKVQIWACNGNASQNWTFEPDGSPGGAGTLTIHGKCLDIAGQGTSDKSLVQLYRCDSDANQQWLIDGSSGELYNPVSGRCLTDPSTKNGTQLWIYDCMPPAPDQAWILPASPVQSGVTSKCINDPDNATKNGSPVTIWACKGYTSEQWTLEPDGTLRIDGKCLDVAGQSKLDGALVQMYTCKGTSNQLWSISPGGELVNQNSGRCLDDPGAAIKNGTRLDQQDCYGTTQEIWAVT